MRGWRYIGWIVVMVGCGPQAADAPVHDVAAADTASIFAPGVVSTAAPEFSIAFSSSGDRAWFTRASEDRSRLTIMETQRSDGAWSEPVPASFSGSHRDLDPFVTPDGSRLYFSSTRPASDGDTGDDLDTWYIALGGAGAQPVRLDSPYNTDATEVFVSVSRDGTLWFQSDRDGTGRIRAVSPGDTAARMIALDTLATGAGNPLIDPDGRFLIVVMDGGGSPDLFVACRSGDGFGAPRPLGPRVNSAFADFAPALSPDGATLYFTSERPGIAPARSDGSRPPGDIWSIPVAILDLRC